MRAGDILLVQGEGLLSSSIEFLTHGGFSHSGIITSEGMCIEALDSGVVERPVEYGHYAVYEVIGITDEEREGVVQVARGYLNKGYDYSQDLGFAVNALRKVLGLITVPNLFDNNQKIICSALVDVAFRSVGVVLRPDLNVGDITPIGLVYSPKVHLLENHRLWEL